MKKAYLRKKQHLEVKGKENFFSKMINIDFCFISNL